MKHSKKLISADNHSNTFNFHYTYLVTLVPVCKDDLVLLPKRLAEQLGNISRLVITQRISNVVQFCDPLTAQTADVTEEKVSNELFHDVGRKLSILLHALKLATVFLWSYPCLQYWRQEFPALLSSTRLVPYIVLGAEPLPEKVRPTAPRGHRIRKARMAEVELARECDLGRNDDRVHAVTHLGRILRAGDTVLGYDIASANLPDGEASKLFGSFPDVVLVRKVYPKHGYSDDGGKADRQWKLAELEKDGGDNTGGAGTVAAREQESAERDYERFLQQLESDKDMRRQVNLYKAGPAEGAKGVDEVDEEEIQLDELLDGMTLDNADAAPDDDESNFGAGIFDAETAPVPKASALPYADDDPDL